MFTGRIKKTLLKLSAILFVVLMLSACAETTDVGLEGKVHIMVVNTVPDNSTIDLYLDTTKVTAASLSFGSYTSYDTVAGGRRKAEVFIAGKSVLSRDLYLNPYRAYSFFVTEVDSIDKSLTYVATVDYLKEPVSGTNSRVRFVHLSPDENGVDLYTKRDDLPAERKFFNAYYKSVSIFQEFRAGNYTFTLTPVERAEEIISLSNVVLEPKKSYTIFINGYKAATDDKKMKISVIQNN